PAPSTKSGRTTGFEPTVSASAMGIGLRRELLLSFVKNRRPVANTGSDAVKLTVRTCPVGKLIGASPRNEKYWPFAGTVIVAGSAELPEPSVKTTCTLTSSSFGLTIAIDDRILSVISAENTPVARSEGAIMPVWLCVMPSWRYSKSCKPLRRKSGEVESAEAQPVI